MADCQTMLNEARDALHNLMKGEQVVSVTHHDGESVTFTQGTVNQLRRYIRDLELECGQTDATGLNPSRRGAVKFYG
ncbi:MAG: gpW family protein [Candidatus Thiodiazotropha sp. (ex Troendleina suluensis)]|nr:gpW family protein [Candidatus Thiodiazotropha sp. (ex Troendleina suluensis)]